MAAPRANYAAHEALYRDRRRGGLTGWDDAAGTRRGLAELSRLLRWPGFPAEGRVLEIGCGAADATILLAQLGYRAAGIDISPSAIQWGLEKAATGGVDVDLSVGDVTRLAGFESAAFDAVVDGHCLHCIIGADRAVTIESVHRVLQPGGVFLVRSMVNDPPASRFTGFDPVSRCDVLDGVAVRYYARPSELLAEIEAAGFQVLRSRIYPAKAGTDDCDEAKILAQRQKR